MMNRAVRVVKASCVLSNADAVRARAAERNWRAGRSIGPTLLPCPHTQDVARSVSHGNDLAGQGLRRRLGQDSRHLRRRQRGGGFRRVERVGDIVWSAVCGVGWLVRPRVGGVGGVRGRVRGA